LTNNVLPNNITAIPINNGSTNYTIANSGSTWGTTAVNPVMTLCEPATLDVKGTLVLNGQNLEERLKIIEDVLHIPERDVKLEKKYPKLKKMYDAYIRELAKYRTFEAIKGDNNGTT